MNEPSTSLSPLVTPAGALSPAGRAAAATAGLCAIGLAVYGALSTAPPEADYDSLGGNLREVVFFAYLVGSILGIAAMYRAGIATKRPTFMIGVGYGLVAFGVLAGFVLRDDPAWFVVVGGPGNLLALIGWIVFAVVTVRSQRLPTWAAVLAGVGGVFAVLFADFGSGVLIGCFWLYLAPRTSDQAASSGNVRAA